jgi:hypothetical protein
VVTSNVTSSSGTNAGQNSNSPNIFQWEYKKSVNFMDKLILTVILSGREVKDLPPPEKFLP